MSPIDFSTDELEEFKCDLETALKAARLSFENLRVEVLESQDLLDVTLQLSSDPVIGALDTKQCRVEFFAKLYCLGINIEGPVIFGGFVHSMSKDSSYFFPIPDEYGDWVSLRVDWEFHPQTLCCGYGSVRDRESLHHVNVQPSNDLKAFIKVLSLTARKWEVSHEIHD